MRCGAASAPGGRQAPRRTPGAGGAVAALPRWQWAAAGADGEGMGRAGPGPGPAAGLLGTLPGLREPEAARLVPPAGAAAERAVRLRGCVRGHAAAGAPLGACVSRVGGVSALRRRAGVCSHRQRSPGAPYRGLRTVSPEGGRGAVRVPSARRSPGCRRGCRVAPLDAGAARPEPRPRGGGQGARRAGVVRGKCLLPGGQTRKEVGMSGTRRAGFCVLLWCERILCVPGEPLLAPRCVVLALIHGHGYH